MEASSNGSRARARADARATRPYIYFLSAAGVLLDDAWIELRADNDQDGCDHKEDAEIG